MRPPHDTLDAVIAMASLAYYIGAPVIGALIPFMEIENRRRNLLPFLCIVMTLFCVSAAELAVIIYQARGCLSTSAIIVPFAHIFTLLLQVGRMISCILFREENGLLPWHAFLGSWFILATSHLISIVRLLRAFSSETTDPVCLAALVLRFYLILGLLIPFTLPNERGRIHLDDDVYPQTPGALNRNTSKDALEPSVISEIRSAGGFWSWITKFHIFTPWVWSKAYLTQIAFATFFRLLEVAISILLPAIYGWFLASIARLDTATEEAWHSFFWLMTIRYLSSGILSSIQGLAWDRFKLSQAAYASVKTHEYQMRHGTEYHEDIQLAYKYLADSWVGEVIDVPDSILMKGGSAFLAAAAAALAIWSSYGLLVLLLQLYSFAMQQVFTACAQQHLRRLLDETNAAYQETQRHLSCGINEWKTISIYGQEERNIKEFEAAQTKLTTARCKEKKWQCIMDFTTDLIATGSFCAAFIIVIWNTSHEGKIMEAIAAFEGYSGMLNANLTVFLKLQDEALRRLFNVDRFRRLLEYPQNMKYGTEDLCITDGCIEFKQVTFSYRGCEKPVFEGFDLVCEPGEMTAIIGPSGSGKSTCFDLLMRRRDPQEGCVQIDRQDIRSLKKGELSRYIAYMPQDPKIIDGSYMQNIKYARPDATDREAYNAAKSVGIHDHIMSRPEGYNTMISENSATLSGGQKQRLMIARTLVLQPKVLLLDEVTSALDSESEQVVKNCIKDNYEETTVVLITHRVQMTKCVDRIIVLGQGESGSTVIIESGTYDELRKKGGEYDRLWKLSTEMA